MKFSRKEKKKLVEEDEQQASKLSNKSNETKIVKYVFVGV